MMVWFLIENNSSECKNQDQVILVPSRHHMMPLILYFGSDNIMLEMKEYAIFLHIGHANTEFAWSIRLPCAADLPISHIG